MLGWFSFRKDIRVDEGDDDASTPTTDEVNAVQGTSGPTATSSSEPFLGGYKNLYEETAECLLASMVIYGFADVRALAASSESESLSKLLELPQSRSQLLRAFVVHEEELKAQMDTDVYMSALDTLAPDLRKVLAQESDRKDPVEIVAFDDNASSLELVYSVTLDHDRRLIRVSFRGSTTVTDWLYDADIRMETADNPIRKMEESTGETSTIRQSRHIGLHAGFRGYLFLPQEQDRSDEKVPRSPIIESILPAKVIKKGDHCKYDVILRQIKAQLETYPNYTIQVTGHSLGGALATLLAFCLACELENIPQGPITCISFASPRVGNGNFGRAFQELEHRGRLRNIRVANAEDLVTAIPDTTFSVSFLTHAMRSNFFLHTGACLQLKTADQPAEWVYPPISRTKDGHFRDDWAQRTQNLAKKAGTFGRVVQGQVDFLKWHSCDEYLSRLQKEKDALSAMSFAQVYDEYYRRLDEEGNGEGEVAEDDDGNDKSASKDEKDVPDSK